MKQEAKTLMKASKGMLLIMNVFYVSVYFSVSFKFGVEPCSIF